MTDPYTITLDVRNGASNGNDGYTNTSTTDGQTYCYRWTGGTDNAGDVLESIRAGVAQINVQLRADSRYHIVTGGFGDGNTQFSFSVTDNYNGVISDVGTVAENDYFNLQVSDSSRQNCTFWCDPRVGNQD
jgi:hypothetical protein